IEKTSANVNKDTSHKNNNEGFVKKDETISNITGSRTNDSIIDKGGLKTNKLRQKDLSLKYPKAVPCSLEEFNGKSVSSDSKKLEQSINKSVPTIKKPKKISEPINIANKSINKGKDNGTINRSNDISHNDVSKADPRRKTTPDLSLKYPKAVSCSLEEIFGETIFPNSKKSEPAIRMPSGNKREECAKKPDPAVRMPSGSKREEYAKKPDPAIRMPSGSKREECAKKPDSAIRMSNSSKREECVSVSTHHKPKDLTHLKTLEDYQREAEAMGHKLPSDRDPPDTTYYPRIKRLLDPASLKYPLTSPYHPMNVIKYLATVPPRTNTVQLNKIKRVQYPNFVGNKSTSRIGTKGQINRPATEKKVTSLSKMNSDTRRTFSKSISELHRTPNARNERLTPRGLSIARESPQVRDKLHVTHKGSLQSTNRKRIAHEESSVRDPSMIKRRLTNNTLPPTQQMSKKRPMHFSPEPSRPAKRHQIRRNREGSIDEMDVSSIIQSIFRRGRDRPI
ncbi:4685_t:CDS:1, partial [Gigaspora rosea]